MWDDRDLELGLRDKLAAIVAEKTSGSEGAIPEDIDYVIADKCAELMTKEIGF
jgi:hypothetical protein